MSSIIKGYNYDIFISYRQKDNRYDGWVTEFVDNLRKELEATFKEEVSLYFDINPHDGLLETHDVEASLKEKLKCLIFIPIISRTYCDPKSFAWEHEFKAFVEMASKDQYGLKVRLPSGNIASRVLPVRIHELDRADMMECEQVMEGPLRGIEFIYKAAGVNRPLRLKEEKPQENLNNSIYRDQINKVANSVKEIISGLKPGHVEPKNVAGHNYTNAVAGPEVKVRSNVLSITGWKKVLATMLLTGIIFGFILVGYHLIFQGSPVTSFKPGDTITVAVFPFRNLTKDKGKNYIQESIQISITNTIFIENILPIPADGIIDILERQGYTEYEVLNPQKGKFLTSRLKADILITGSIIEAGNNIRITAECTDLATGKLLRIFPLSSPNQEASIISKADTLGLLIRNYLLVTLLKKELSPNLRLNKLLTDSPDALKAFIEGAESYRKLDFISATESFEVALQRDSDFVLAMIQVASAYNYLRNWNPSVNRDDYLIQTRKWRKKAYGYRERFSGFERLYIECSCSQSIDQNERLKNWEQMIEKYKYPSAYFNIGNYYLGNGQVTKAIEQLNKSLLVYEEMGVVPWLPNYLVLGRAYCEEKDLKKAEKVYDQAEKYYPGHIRLLYNKAILYLTFGDSVKAKNYIEKFSDLCSDSTLNYILACMYEDAKIPEKAEEYYNKVRLEYPGNHIVMDDMASFLIDNKKVKEGTELADSALLLSPDNYDYMDTKAWGLYKQKRYDEALNLALRARDMRIKAGGYSLLSIWHLDSIKKARERSGNYVQ